ncbi:MAG: mechanosensitive ion channel [Cyanobacteriota bacterium]|nr:mechanosensitive ion channel [Cyanobacteriota bacterium]
MGIPNRIARNLKLPIPQAVNISRRYRLFFALVFGIVFGVLLFGLWLQPALTQTEPEAIAQPVILDGQKLFELGSSETFDASQRAEIVNAELERAARSTEPIEVELEERNGLPVISIGERHLLTVTQSDVEPEGRPPLKQAKQWRQEIQDALKTARDERSAEFMRRTLLEALVVACVAAAAYRGLGWAWKNHFVWDAVGTWSKGWQKLRKLLLLLARSIVVIVAILYITNLFPWTRQWTFNFINTIFTSLSAPLLTTDERSYSLVNLLVLILLMIGLMFAANSIASQLRGRVLPMTRLNRNAQEVVATVVKYTFITIGTVVILQAWGLDITSLTILASALSVGIGFGFQDIAKNLGSGIVLLFERPIQVGDFVQVGDFKGTIERIGSRSTIIRTLDRVSIIVPNSRFLESEVLNWSHECPMSRIRLPVGVAYGSDIQMVRSTLLEAAKLEVTKKNSELLDVPTPHVVFVGFGDSSLDFELWVWSEKPARHPAIVSDLYFRIEDLFRERDIEIPFPQRDLHVRSGNLPIELSPPLEEMLLQLLKVLKH